MAQQLSTVLPAVFNQIKPGATFMSIMGYKNNFDEVSNFGIVFHANYLNAVNKALKIFAELRPDNSIQKQAKTELLLAYTESAKGFRLHGRSPHVYSYVCDGNNKPIDGVKWFNRGREAHLYGFMVHKKILKPGNYSRAVSLNPLEVEKRKMLGMTPLGNFRQFKLIEGRFDHIGVAGMTLTQQDLIRNIEG